MAASSKLKAGDLVTLRWRDRNGAFDATEIRIAGVFKTNVPTVDGSQIWLPLSQLQKMMLMTGEATILVNKQKNDSFPAVSGWKVKDLDFLLADMNNIIKSKTAGGMVLWGILMMLALLAIFDTQVLAIFRRQKEIGMYIALGMTKRQVVALFTTEGAMHAVLATLLGAVYGIPLLALQAVKGISFPVSGSDYGISMAERLYPHYGIRLIIITILIVMIATTIVSYWPARKIAKMKPTDALRGKIQ